MSDEKKHRFTVKIADVEPIAFTLPLAEEPIFRKAAIAVNKVWERMRNEQSEMPSHYTLAKVALAFAELYCRKEEQLNMQFELLDKFEKDLDDILMQLD